MKKILALLLITHSVCSAQLKISDMPIWGGTKVGVYLPVVVNGVNRKYDLNNLLSKSDSAYLRSISGVAVTSFGSLTGKPTTLAGYGITNAALSVHSHVATDVTNFSTATDARITAKVNTPNGLPALDATGKIPTTYFDTIPVDFSALQPKLVSGENIKKINNMDITGPGNLTTTGSALDTANNLKTGTAFPTDGNIVIKNNRLYFRSGGFWHSTQVGTDSVSDVVAGQNFLRYSEQLEQFVAWDFPLDTTIMGVTVNALAGPFGGTVAETVTLKADFLPFPQQVTVTPNTVYTFSFYAKIGTVSALYGLAVDDVTHSAAIVNGTNIYPLLNSSSWTRVSTSFTTPAGCTAIYCYLLRTLTERGTVYLSGAQLNQGALRGYQVTTSAAIP